MLWPVRNGINARASYKIIEQRTDMKLHLPIALLTAIMLCTSAVYASGVYTITDADTINVADSSTIKISESADVYNQLSREGYAAPKGDSNPNAILKSGNGALVID